MSLAEMICDAGHTTLAQYLCDPPDWGTSTVIGGEVIDIYEVKPSLLESFNGEDVLLSEVEPVKLEELDIIVEIESIKDGTIDGLC